MKRVKSVFCLFLGAMLILSVGCASKKTSETVTADYYPACHEPLLYLKHRSSTGKAVAAGAVQGGVISGIAAAIIGAIAGGIRPVGILTSVGVGATLGGVAGAASSTQEKEDNAHMAAYLEQIDGDIDGLDLVGAAATASMQCYNKEFTLLLEAMKGHSLTAGAARERFKEIAAGREEAAQLLHKDADTPALEKQFSEAEEEMG